MVRASLHTVPVVTLVLPSREQLAPLLCKSRGRECIFVAGSYMFHSGDVVSFHLSLLRERLAVQVNAVVQFVRHRGNHQAKAGISLALDGSAAHAIQALMDDNNHLHSRRRRFRTELRVAVWSPRTFTVGTVLDISASGCFLHCRRGLLPGETVTIRPMLGRDSKDLVLTGRVVRLAPELKGAGIHFTRATHPEALQRFIVLLNQLGLQQTMDVGGARLDGGQEP